MAKRQVEVFIAGCPVCEPAVELVNEMACPSCEVTVHDLHGEGAAAKASAYGVRSVPAVVVDGRLVSCCDHPGLNREALIAAGLGQPFSELSCPPPFLWVVYAMVIRIALGLVEALISQGEWVVPAPRTVVGAASILEDCMRHLAARFPSADTRAVP